MIRDAFAPCVLVIAMALASGCDRTPDAEKGNLYKAAADDPRLAEAAAEARRRWPEFAAAFAKREPNVAYAVKLAFPIRGGDSLEHMWIQVTSIQGTTITGELNNEPIKDVGLKLGDPVTTTVDQIEDWLIGRGQGNVTGAFSIRVLEEIKKEKGGKP